MYKYNITRHHSPDGAHVVLYIYNLGLSQLVICEGYEIGKYCATTSIGIHVLELVFCFLFVFVFVCLLLLLLFFCCVTDLVIIRIQSLIWYDYMNYMRTSVYSHGHNGFLPFPTMKYFCWWCYCLLARLRLISYSWHTKFSLCCLL